MTWPEPSINDHDADYNREEIGDENGDIHIVCGCTNCKVQRKKAYLEEYGTDE